MLMYNLIEYSKSYRKTTVSLWHYYRDELTDNTKDINILNENVINSEYFKYKTSITGSTFNVDTKITNAEVNEFNNPAVDASKSGKKDAGIAVPLRYLSNFWRAIKMPLTNCEVSLTLSWSRECVITSMGRRVVTNARKDISPAGPTFRVTNTKLYVPVFTLSTQDNNKLLEQLRTGFKRTIKWN